MPEVDAKLFDTLRSMLVQIDDGPRDCVGVMRDGTWTWKGSFLAHVERVRAMLPAEAETE